ncbi:MAG: sigma-70 family RNA polymerase sigma factor [Phycisphaerales bacterium]|nr:sigma-70 family RNA polymerase sigma factor [Phycisphaerales bacterium]
MKGLPLDAHDSQDLMARAAAGDDQAWASLVEHYAPRVHALLVANCRDHDLAEEITQSTFCTIAAKVQTYVEQGKFEPWLFRIAMNRLRDEMRRRGRQATPVPAETLRPVAATGREDRAPHAQVDAETAAALWDAVRGLGEADQRVLHLRHVAGLSFKQIAAQVEQPVGTVLARHFRALKRLREVLGDEIAEDFARRGQ